MERNKTETGQAGKAERAAKRAARKAENEAYAAKRAAFHAEARAIVATGKCPDCGAAIHRNSSMAGWWQCDRLGAVGFRRDLTGPSCSWQTFTE